jgi:superfamily I DNA/RNA helicase
VGDINQSIFEFANKSSEFLLSIAQDSTFKVFPLSKNYRCHPSIINYSMKLISRDFVDFIPTTENRMFGITITGKETNIASWLDNNIRPTMQKYGVTDFNEVAILARSKRTGKIIDENLQLKHKFFDSTPFDSDSSLWGTVFVDVLRFIFDTKNTKYAFIETYFDVELQKDKARAVMSLLSELETIDKASVVQHKETIVRIAELIFPKASNRNSINILEAVLNDNKLLESFKAANEDEVQIMTLHKSKGLEFGIVFHLDLYEYIFPKKTMNENGEFVFSEPKQDVNLHYVGITRAKECCILCSSTKRTNAKGYIKNGNKSEFLRLSRLETLRQVF